jgi:uncharacterized membrane protein YfcA
MTIIIGLLLGAVIGSLLGLLGGGGSILAVPALVYVAGYDVKQAIPTSLIVIAAASIVGRYRKCLRPRFNGAWLASLRWRASRPRSSARPSATCCPNRRSSSGSRR